jgi:hypothetical protein
VRIYRRSRRAATSIDTKVRMWQISRYADRMTALIQNGRWKLK